MILEFLNPRGVVIESYPVVSCGQEITGDSSVNNRESWWATEGPPKVKTYVDLIIPQESISRFTRVISDHIARLKDSYDTYIYLGTPTGFSLVESDGYLHSTVMTASGPENHAVGYRTVAIIFARDYNDYQSVGQTGYAAPPVEKKQKDDSKPKFPQKKRRHIGE